MAWRYLKGNKTTTSPTALVCLDTETDRRECAGDGTRWIESLRLGVARHCRLERGEPTRRTEFAFQHAPDFWTWLLPKLRPRETTWLFAHGLAFDARVIKWPEAVDAGLLKLAIIRPGKAKADGTAGENRTETGLCVFDGSPTILECWSQSGAKLRMIDTLNYWQKPLADLGRSIGLDKLPFPDPWDSDEAWLEYCRVDCEILERAVLNLIRWHRANDLGVFKMTAASIAMQAFRHKWNKPPFVIHDEKQIRKLEREGYYAGQLSTFYLGRIRRSDKGVSGALFDKFGEAAPRPVGPVHQLDINALFPSQMASGVYPMRLRRWRDQPEWRRREPPPLDQGFLARVLLDSPIHAFPLRVKGRTHHVVGRFWTTLCGPELAFALRAGCVQAVDDWAEYELGEPFRGFVEYFWGQRLSFRAQGDQASADLCKLILNSLYGKFAQHSFEWAARPKLTSPLPWYAWVNLDKANNVISELRAVGGLVQERQKRDDHPQSFVAVSAWVTSHARERMRALREIVGRHHCFYQAVDSLYVDDLGLARLQAAGEIDQTALGKLRLEHSADEAEFLGLGYYKIGDRRVISSIRKTAKVIDSEVYEQDQFESLARSFSRQPAGGVIVKRIVKRTRAVEPLSGVTENGWVRPLDAGLCLSNATKAETSPACCPAVIGT
jgi:DNA polymerase type B, organellar and viral